MFGAARQAAQAVEAAAQAQQTIDRHMAECVVRHSDIKLQLTRQDGALEKIQTFLGRCLWGVLSLLVTVIGGLLVFISNAIHIHLGP